VRTRPPEPLEQGDGAGTRSAAQIEDPARRRIGGQLADPAGHLGQVGVQDFGVEVEEFGQGGQGRRVGLGGRAVLVVVMAFHTPTLRLSCTSGIASCV
jgi:hypothetical protein